MALTGLSYNLQKVDHCHRETIFINRSPDLVKKLTVYIQMKSTKVVLGIQITSRVWISKNQTEISLFLFFFEPSDVQTYRINDIHKRA